MGKRIKDTYQKQLWVFISANVVVFWVISLHGAFDYELANLKISELMSSKSIFFIVLPILALVFSGSLSNPIKEFLVFWKVKNRLPGCRAFTKFAISDQRIDIHALKNYLGKLPEEPTEQNRLWYKLYKEVGEDKIIMGSHRDFLLSRDLCSISFLFALAAIPLGLFFWEDQHIFSVYMIFMVLQYIIVSVSARNFGNRFVCNVLVHRFIMD